MMKTKKNVMAFSQHTTSNQRDPTRVSQSVSQSLEGLCKRIPTTISSSMQSLATTPLLFIAPIGFFPLVCWGGGQRPRYGTFQSKVAKEDDDERRRNRQENREVGSTEDDAVVCWRDGPWRQRLGEGGNYTEVGLLIDR